MNNKQKTVYKSLVDHSKGYSSASLGMIRANVIFFQSYNGVRLTKQEADQVLNEFLENSGLEIV